MNLWQMDETKAFQHDWLLECLQSAYDQDDKGKYLKVLQDATHNMRKAIAYGKGD